MSKFRFAPQRDWTGSWYTPESTDVPDTAESSSFKFAPQSNPTGLTGGTAVLDKPFRFAREEPFRFAPARKEADPTGLFSPVKSHDEHDDGDCDCHGSCSSCSAEYMKFMKSARPATKLEVGSRVRCKSCPGQPGKKVMVVRELTATEKGYLLSVDYEDGSGSMHGIFDHDELVAA
jgi:hypothetical protein